MPRPSVVDHSNAGRMLGTRAKMTPVRKMNAAAARSLQAEANRIVDGTFDQRAVKLLIVDLRDVTGRGSAVREIGDFIAHPTIRDRGPTHGVITSVHAEFVAGFRAIRKAALRNPNSWRTAFKVTTRTAFQQADIIESLIRELRLCVANPDELEISVRRQQNDIMICLLCLLQGVEFAVGADGARADLGVIDDGTLALIINLDATADAAMRGALWPIIRSTVPVVPDRFEHGGKLGRFEGAREAVRGEDGALQFRALR